MRVGPHLHTRDKLNDARAFVKRSGASATKALDGGLDRGYMGWCRDQGMVTIGRVYWQHQRLGASYGRFIDRVLEHAHAFPEVTHWEGANEAFMFCGCQPSEAVRAIFGDEQPHEVALPDRTDVLSLDPQSSDVGRYAQHEIERMKALESIGRKAIIGNFSTGQPEPEAWPHFLPALIYALEHDHVLGLHEYSGPHMRWMETWLCLRYRRVLRLLEELHPGLGRIKIALTETGVDDVNPRPGPQGKGWRDYAGTEWARLPLSPEGDFSGQMRWYGSELSRDPNVVAWVDFGFGTASHPEQGINQWGSFDIVGTAQFGQLADAMRGLPRHPSAEPVPPTPPPSEPQPAPEPGPPPAEPLEPRLTDAVQPMIRPIPRKGWAAMAGLAAGHPDAPYGQRIRWAREMAEANGVEISSDLAARSAWVVPWFGLHERGDA